MVILLMFSMVVDDVVVLDCVLKWVDVLVVLVGYVYVGVVVGGLCSD